jgi:hypothetical protein
MNPRIGCGLQQCSRRQLGESRRGGEKPRGRNETPSVARGGRWYMLRCVPGVDELNGEPMEGTSRRRRGEVDGWSKREAEHCMAERGDSDFTQRR